MTSSSIWQSEKFQRKLALAVATIILLGFLTAAAAWRRQARLGAAQTESEGETSPLAGMSILVDPGHGGYDGGARARDSGTWEKHINLAVALQLEKALTARGASVTLTRREDVDLCSADRPASVTKKRQDMERRVALAGAAGADMVLSVHMNEYRSRRVSGPQVFYRKASDSGRLLAGCVQQALIDAVKPAHQRTAMAGDYFILQLDIPSVLVECGFLSNPAEEKLLLTPAYQAKLGEAIAQGAEEYVTLSRRLTAAPTQTPPAAAP